MDLVFLHGFLGCPADWDLVIAALKEEFSCHALPLPLAIESFPFSFERCHLVGYSMGGRIALQLKQRYPERIGQLVLLGAHLGLKDKKEKEKRQAVDRAWAEKLRTRPLQEFLQFWYAQPLFDGFTVPEQRFHIDAHYHAALLENYSLSKQSYWEPPQGTLLLCGEKDKKYHAHYGERAFLIPRAGHAAHLENPMAIAHAIAQSISPT